MGEGVAGPGLALPLLRWWQQQNSSEGQIKQHREIAAIIDLNDGLWEFITIYLLLCTFENIPNLNLFNV